MRMFHSLFLASMITFLSGVSAIGIRSHAMASEHGAMAELTAEETAWIQEHPVIRVGVDHYPPFEIVSDTGDYEGLGAEYLGLVGKNTGLKFKILTGLAWAKVLEGAQNGTVDMIPVITPSPERHKFLNFTEGYLHHPQVIVTRHGHEAVKGIADLKGQTMAVSEGYSEIEDLNRDFPEIKQLVVRNPLDELRRVSSGAADACQGNMAVFNYYIQKYNLLNLKIAGPSDIGGSGAMTMGSRKDWPLLSSILKKGLRAIQEHQRITIAAKWTPALAGTRNAALALTEEEQAWLDENPLIKVAATPDWPPFEFEEKGQYKGLHADVLRLAAQKAGLQVEPVFGKWSDLVAQLKNGRLDLCPGLNATDERKEYLVFTDDLVSESSQVIIAPTGAPVESIRELDGKTVSVEKGYGTETFLKRNYPNITLLLVTNTLEALKAVITGGADAYCGNQAVALYLIKKNTFSGLGVTAFFNEAKALRYRIGVIKDKPVLRNILQKALAAITTEEMTALQEKWFGVAMKTRTDRPDLKLTGDEKAWIKEHPKIKVAAVSDWPPFEFEDDNGAYAGITADIFRLAAHRAELDVELVFGNRQDVYAKLRNKQLDVAPGLVKNREREQFLLFTDSFASSEDVLWIRDTEQKIGSLEDLKNKTVVVEKDDTSTILLKKRYPDIKVLSVNTTLEALETLSGGAAEAYIGSKAVAAYLKNKHYIANIKIVSGLGTSSLRLRMGIRNDAPLLHSALQKALDSISQKERSDIIRSYIPSMGEDEIVVELSPDERAWLRGHKTIRLGVNPSFPPFELMDPKDGYGGIVSEYVRFLAGQFDLKMTPVPDLTWQEVMEKAKAGGIDLVPGLVKSPEQETFLNFTKPYASFPVVIFGHKEGRFISGLSDLKGMTVGVMDQYFIHDFLSKNYPDLTLKPFDTLPNALTALSNGTIAAFVNDLASASYVINALNIPNLNVAALTPHTLDLVIGVRKDWPELVPVLDKALESITPQLADDFKKKWLSLEFTVGLSLRAVLKWVLPIAFGLTTIIFVIVVWNRRLGREIAERKKAQQERDDAFDVITSSIRYASRIQRAVLPSDQLLQETTKDYFILWEPRDVVGGDIYWCRKWGRGSVLILADCTGHGVPGAFMTLISSGALDFAVLNIPEGNPAALISKMHQLIQVVLGQDQKESEADDGLELGVCYIPETKDRLIFSGAGFPLFIVEKDEVSMIKGDRKGIGYRNTPFDTVFTNHQIDITEGRSFYMTSDGIIDQIGGEKRRGFGKKRFKRLLSTLNAAPLCGHGDAIYAYLKEYQGNESRRDDVSVMGFKL